MAAVAVGFASCDEYTLPNPPAQSNPEGDVPVFNAADLSVSAVITDGKINLNQYAGENVPVGRFTVSGLPAGYEMVADFLMSTDEQFTTTDTLRAASHNGELVIEAYDFNNKMIEMFGYEPVPMTLYTRLAMIAKKDNSEVRIGGPDSYYIPETYVVTKYDLGYIIETEYYLVGNFCDWDITKAKKMTQVTPGNPYDNPEFMANVEITDDMEKAGGVQWKVVPLSGYEANSWAGAYGVVAGTTDLVLAPGKDDNRGDIKEVGSYLVNINMRTLRYNVEEAYNFLYVPTGMNNTSTFSNVMRLETKDFIKYDGTMQLMWQFYFTGQTSLKGARWYSDGDTEKDDKGVLTGKFKKTSSETKQMKAPVTSLYYLTADMNKMTYKATPIHKVCLIGAFNDWKAETAPAMTASANMMVYTITQDMPAGSFKFLADNDPLWAISWGGSEDHITQNGGDLNIATAGKYEIELHFDTYPNYVKVTPK